MVMTTERNMKWIGACVVSATALLSCAPKQGGESALNRAAYALEIDAWHAKRVEELKGPNGWLNLVGLYWLKEGINTFGSGDANTIVFPTSRIAKQAGFFQLKDGMVTLEAAKDADITCNGSPVKHMVVFHPDSSRQPKLEHGTLQWFVIKRDNRYGIRLRDFESPAIKGFTDIQRFAVDPSWRLEADFVATPGRTIPITNVLGQTTPTKAPGTLVFTIGGKEYKLDAIDEGGDELFIIVGDATNTKETYGAGRYLYVNPPDKNGKVIIDFNKCYNPPCAFTDFATCPLPPKQNVLPVRITAGEKNYHLAASYE